MGICTDCAFLAPNSAPYVITKQWSRVSDVHWFCIYLHSEKDTDVTQPDDRWFGEQSTFLLALVKQ